MARRPELLAQAIKTVDAQPHDTRVHGIPRLVVRRVYGGETCSTPSSPRSRHARTSLGSRLPSAPRRPPTLLQAVDGRLQGNLLDPDAVAPLARLMGVGDVLLDMDLQTDRYGLIPPGNLWRYLHRPQAGRPGSPTTYGPKVRTLADRLSDVARPPTAPPPAVAVVPVDDPLPIVRAASAADPIVIDGDSEGLVDVATVGLLDPRRLVVYSPSYETRTGCAARARRPARRS